MARLKDTIIEGNARVTGSLYTPSAMLTDLEVVNNLTVDGNINDYFVIKTTDNEIMKNDYSIFFIAFCELSDNASVALSQQFNCGELYFKRNNSLKSPIHLHVEMANKYSPANSCWCFTYGTARLNPLLKDGNYTTKGTIDYYPCTLLMSSDGTSPLYGGILFSSKNKFQKIQFSGFSGGFQPFGIQLGYYGSDLTAPNGTWLNPGTGEYKAATCPYTINFDNVFINDSNVIDMSQADMILSRLYLKDRLRMNEGEPINQRLITTAAACQAAKKDGSNYVPALWKFDANATAIDGDIITIKIPLAPHTYGNYLSIDNGANYYPIVVYDRERLNSQYPVGTYLQLVFEADGSVDSIFPIEGSTSRSSSNNCGVWRVINYYDTNTEPYGIRVYKQTTGYNGDYPLLVSRSLGSAIGTNNTNDSYTSNIYGVIWNDSTKVPTLNPSTGLMKVPGGITANLTGNASRATLAQKVGHGQVTNTAIGSFDLAMGQMTAITANHDNTTLPSTSNNANAEIIIKAYNTSPDGASHYEARLGFNSNHSLYVKPVNATYWRKVITTGNDVNTAVGSLSQPIYVDTNGIVQNTKKMFQMEYDGDGDYVLTSGDNLNSLTSGVYVSRSSSSSGQITNMPITGSGAIIVNFGGYAQNHSNDQYRRQFVFGNNSNIYYRYEANDTWQDWHKLVQAPTSGSAGSDTKPVYVNSNGCLVTAVESKYLKVNLESSIASNSDGTDIYTSNKVILGVTGELPISHGGTGANTAQGAVRELGISGIYYVNGTQTAKTGTWTGNLTTVSELYAGLTIAYYLPYDGDGNATLNLTLANNQKTGAKPVYYSADSRFTTHLAAHSVLILTWVPDTTSAGGAWRRGDRDTDANSKVYVYWSDAPHNIELPLMAASSNNTGAFAKPANGKYTTSFALISTNYPKVNPSTGCVTLYDLKVTNKITGTLNANYGEVLPENPTEGQIFFQLSEPHYELPIGGFTGQCLVKRSNTDRDVMWGTSVPNGGTTGQALLKVSDADGDVSWGTVNVNDKVSKSGDTMTGDLIMSAGKSVNHPGGAYGWIYGRDSALVRTTSYIGYNAVTSLKTTDGSWEMGVYVDNNLWFTYVPDAKYNAHDNTGYGQTHIGPDGKVYGAVWNDYAEMRAVPLPKNITPGSCVYEMGDDTMAPTYQRLQKGCKIVSDTFGFNIGETDMAKTPIAVAGRALVYLFEGREAARNAIGEFVCSGPNGTVSIMTTEEYLQNPQAVVGTISAVPDYEEWGSTNVKVNGRIWIYVR